VLQEILNLASLQKLHPSNTSLKKANLEQGPRSRDEAALESKRKQHRR
jgi:hypothetical protein